MKLSKGLPFVALAVNAEKGDEKKKNEISSIGERTTPQACAITFQEAHEEYGSKQSAKKHSFL